MPKISVIIPCYNVQNYLDRCMESIIKQTIGYEDLEIICVDDCSTDNTLDTLEKWEKDYPNNVLIVKSPENGRQGQARNIGLGYASGDWIAFIDADDWIETDYFESMLEVTKKGDYEIIACREGRDPSGELSYFSDKSTGLPNKDIHINTEELRKELLMNHILTYSAWGKLIKKSFLIENDLLFYKNLTYEDAAWGSLVYLYLKDAYILEKKLYHYYVNEQSTVLSKNSNHHMDCITTQTILWEEYARRGFLNKYRQELEIEHIYSAYLAGMKMLILRYEVPDYNIYLLLRELIKQRIPDYRSNAYIKAGILDEKYMLMMVALENQLNKPQFYDFAKKIKKIGI